MSFNVTLFDGVEVAKVPRHAEGGTYVLGGTTQATLNITYNYSRHYYEHLDKEQGLHWLEDKTGAETRGRLATAVKALGSELDEDYWADTPGNAGFALYMLLTWAALHPEATWRVD